MAKKSNGHDPEHDLNLPDDPVQLAEKKLKAAADNLQVEKGQLEKLTLKRDRYVRALEKATEQRKESSYKAHVDGDAAAKEALQKAQERTRRAELELQDYDSAVESCRQRIVDLENAQQQAQSGLYAAQAEAKSLEILDVAADLDRLAPKLVDLLAAFKNATDEAAAYGHNVNPDHVGPGPFTNLRVSDFSGYLSALMLERCGFTVFSRDSHAARRMFLDPGSFTNYITLMVGKARRQLLGGVPIPPPGTDLPPEPSPSTENSPQAETTEATANG